LSAREEASRAVANVRLCYIHRGPLEGGNIFVCNFVKNPPNLKQFSPLDFENDRYMWRYELTHLT